MVGDLVAEEIGVGLLLDWLLLVPNDDPDLARRCGVISARETREGSDQRQREESPPIHVQPPPLVQFRDIDDVAFMTWSVMR